MPNLSEFQFPLAQWFQVARSLEAQNLLWRLLGGHYKHISGLALSQAAFFVSPRIINIYICESSSLKFWLSKTVFNVRPKSRAYK